MVKSNDSTNLAEMLQEISEAENPLLQMLGYMCQELMELEVSKKLNAGKSERADGRTGYRSGHRDRRFDTRMGTLSLAVPKIRNGGYVPFFVEKWQRSEQALITAIHDIYVEGVSTRKVAKLVENLGIEDISAAEVSVMSKKLDDQIEAFRHKDLSDRVFPILWVDALYENVRVNGRVIKMAIEVVCGVDTEGHRAVLAIEPMAEESKDSYLSLFRGLRNRGLSVPKLVVSDAHSGLVAAIGEGFPGTSWQRCKVHFMRNILARIPKSAKDSFAAELKQIWLAPTAPEAREKARQIIAKHESKYPGAISCLEEGLEDSLTFYSFPSIDSKKIATSNMIERLNKEIRRRTKVVGIFPNTASYLRLVGSYLLEYTEDWGSDRCYIAPAALQQMMSDTSSPVLALDTAAGLDRTPLAG